jgi:hypothetical protein
MNKIYKVQKFSNGDKTVAFIGVMHINKPEYYQKIKKDIDSLRAAGYSIMYEGVKPDSTLGKEKIEYFHKKLRKITGFYLTSYLDTLNQDMGKFRVKGFVDQTQELTGINKLTDIRADLALDSLISVYERKRGPITLSSCDIDTKLGDKYKCGKKNKENFTYLVLNLRNEHLANVVLKHPNKKIAILYGDKHKYGLLQNLKSHDTRWNMIPLWQTTAAE